MTNIFSEPIEKLTSVAEVSMDETWKQRIKTARDIVTALAPKECLSEVEYKAYDSALIFLTKFVNKWKSECQQG